MNNVFPIILFLIFFLADCYKTKKGILPDARNEGNPITGYLYRNTSRRVFSVVHICYSIVITILILFGGWLGLWIGYSAVVYNFAGFLSWTKINRWKEGTNRMGWTPILFSGALIMGYLLLLLHKWVWR